MVAPPGPGAPGAAVEEYLRVTQPDTAATGLWETCEPYGCCPCSLRLRPGWVDPVGLAEVAERLGVKASTAHVWRHRGLLPAPRRQLAIGPIWDWPVILAWARETGRRSRLDDG